MGLLDAPPHYARSTTGPDGPVHYVVVGEGPPLVLVAAWGPQPGTTAWLTYSGVLERLGAHHRCVAVDLPNFGRTGPLTFHEPAHDPAARAVAAAMDAEGITAAPVVGTSMGATTGIVLALGSPGRVTGLVVGACHASTGGDPYLLAPFPSESGVAAADLAEAPDDEGALRRFLRTLFFDPAMVTDDLVADTMAFRKEHPEHLRAGAASVSVAHSNMALLPEITVPMLVVHGRFDRMVPFEQGLMISSYVPQADLVALNRCGHWPPVERPVEFADQVELFLRRNGL